MSPPMRSFSPGFTWRTLAELLRVVRWDKHWVAELGLVEDDLSPRDRQRYWYQAIGAAKLDGAEAKEQMEQLLPLLRELGYGVE